MPTMNLKVSKKQKKLENHFTLSMKSYEEAQKYLTVAVVALDRTYFSVAIANAAFACELFSKAILYYENAKTHVRKHNLSDLRNQFSEEIKEDIVVKWNCNSSILSSIPKEEWQECFDGLEKDFEEKISEIDEAYEFWRYCFEYEKNDSHVSMIFDYAKTLSKVSKDYYEEASKKHNLQLED